MKPHSRMPICLRGLRRRNFALLWLIYIVELNSRKLVTRWSNSRLQRNHSVQLRVHKGGPYDEPDKSVRILESHFFRIGFVNTAFPKIDP